MKNQTLQKALFSGGCFWGVQYYFDNVPGVLKTTVGYTGGHTKNPTYEEVCSHTTGHAEAILIEFDPIIVNYDTLLKHFFRLHDPTTLNRDGPNIGDSYRSAIFYFDSSQKLSAKNELTTSQSNYKDSIVTEITPAGEFYEAEDYHQKYTEKTGGGFCSNPYEPIK